MVKFGTTIYKLYLSSTKYVTVFGKKVTNVGGTTLFLCKSFGTCCYNHAPFFYQCLCPLVLQQEKTQQKFIQKLGLKGPRLCSRIPVIDFLVFSSSKWKCYIISFMFVSGRGPWRDVELDKCYSNQWKYPKWRRRSNNQRRSDSAQVKPIWIRVRFVELACWIDICAYNKLPKL